MKYCGNVSFVANKGNSWDNALKNLRLWLLGVKMSGFNQREYQAVLPGALLHDAGMLIRR